MVKVLNRTNGRYPDSQVYWSFNGQTRSIAEQPYIDMPANSAGRMYFYLGSPNSQYYDFIEFTVGPDVFNGNTTRVDAFGLKLAMRLHAHDGYDASVGEDQATFAEDRAATFQRFIDEVPAEFKHLAPDPGAVPDPVAGQLAPVPGRRAVRELLHRVRLVGRRLGGHVGHLRLRRVAGQQPGDVRRRSTGTSRTCRSRAVVRRRACTTRPRRRTTTPGSGTTTPSTGCRTASRTTTTPNQSSFVSHGNPQYLLVAVGW